MIPSAFRITSAGGGDDRREAVKLIVVVVERKLADRGQRLDRRPLPRASAGRAAEAIAALNEPLRRLPTMTAK